MRAVISINHLDLDDTSQLDAEFRKESPVATPQVDRKEDRSPEDADSAPGGTNSGSSSPA